MVEPRVARRNWNMLGVPIDSVGEPGGTELGPQALLDAGLLDRSALEDRGATAARLRDATRDGASGVVAWSDVLTLSTELAEKVAELVDPTRPLLVAGGCCTLVPGVLGGLARVGVRPRLVYVDAHLDLYDGRNSPTGEAADMPLAVALGVGPAGWARAAGIDHPIAAEDVVLAGPRDMAEAAGLGSALPEDLGVELIDTQAVRSAGAGSTAERLRRFASAGADGFWVHVDLDVLDPEVFPATDAFVADGLGWDELTDLVRPLVADPACLGMNLVCFNPEKDDAAGTNAERIAELLGAVLV